MTSKREYRLRYEDQKANAQWWYERWVVESEKNDALAEENEELESTIRLQELLIRVLRRKLEAASVQS